MATIYEKENSYYTLTNCMKLQHKKLLLLIKNIKRKLMVLRGKKLYILNEIKYFKNEK